MFRFAFLIIGVFWITTSCELVDIEDVGDVGVQLGVKPIYADLTMWDEIISLPPQPISNLGKIYYKSPYIYVNERFRGIHVIDNTDPTQPIAIAFIQIYGCEDIAINGDILYADNYTDLVAIDISDINNVIVVDRVEDLYTRSSLTFPEGYSGYFECVEEDNGFIIGWEEAELLNPRCLR